MVEIQTNDYGIFQISQCQSCFRYQIGHDPNLVFHGIDSKNISNYKEGIINPNGEPNAKYYYQYIGERQIHLGPLPICGLFEENPFNVWFGFSIRSLQKKYPNLRYMDYFYWEHLGFFSDTLPPEVREEYEKKLFVRDYTVDRTTEVLSHELDCNNSSSIIVQNGAAIDKVRSFLQLPPKVYTISDSQRYFNDLIRSIRSNPRFQDCECGLESLFLATSCSQ